MAKPLVFISYSHRDESEKEQLISHLKVLEKADLIELWIDDKIEGGANWEPEIKQKITQAKVVILLISANFLTSEFILNKEVPNFLKRRQDEGLVVYPIIAKNCAWDTVEWLAKMNVRPKNGTPIWGGNTNQVADNYLAMITREVRDIAKKIINSDSKSTSSSNKISFPAYTSFQNDLENLIQQSMSDFMGIRGESSNSPTTGYTNYESRFSFEYSIHNRIWHRDSGEWYFTCTFCEHITLQQAEEIFIERVQEIKSLLSDDWKFEEREQPDRLYQKEFEAIKRYNTLRILIKMAVYDPKNSTTVDFLLEQIKPLDDKTK